MEEMINEVVNKENELAVAEENGVVDSTEEINDFDITEVETEDKHSCGKAIGIAAGCGAVAIGALIAFKKSKLYQKLKDKKEATKANKNAKFIEEVSIAAAGRLSVEEIDGLIEALQLVQTEVANNEVVEDEVSFTTEETNNEE